MYQDQTLCLILFCKDPLKVKEEEDGQGHNGEDNIVEWTSLGIEEAMRATRDRDRWKRVVLKSTAPLRHPNAMG